MNPTTSNPAEVTYQQILSEIGKHLNERKGLLFKRILLLTWPIIIVGVTTYLFLQGIDIGVIDKETPYLPYYIGGIGLMIFLSAIYYWIASIIFEIEKRIWIDAHFDGKNLHPDESWNIAKSLFGPSVKLWFSLLFRYVLTPVLAFFVIIACSIFLLPSTGSNVVGLQIGLIAVGSISLVIYFYFLRIRLRYLWFIFLDRYHDAGFSHDKIFTEVEELNEVNKSESFKKALVSQFGSDVAKSISNLIVQRLSSYVIGAGVGLSRGGMGILGGGLGSFGVVARVLGEEGSKQITSYGKIIAFYLLYRQARQLKYGEAQINQEYKLETETIQQV